MTNCPPSNNGNLTAAEKLLCEKFLDPRTLLDYISQDDFSSFCQGIVFTARDFGDGTLGLAWLGSPGAVGGACEKNRITSNGKNMSLNTGFVTLVNYNTRQPDSLSKITFAHEIGHALGSTHDNVTNTECVPNNADGNFIMYSRAVNGEKRNNLIYSSCSRYLIGANLDNVVKNKNCLRSNLKICGKFARY